MADHPTENPAPPPLVVNLDDVSAVEQDSGGPWRCSYKPLTPALDALKKPGMQPRLGLNWGCVPPGSSACPFHSHAREDEVFYVLSGRGVLRYGDELHTVGPGDCISCPAGTGIAHQLANPFEEDFVYLSIGLNDSHEVCTYPDSGKVMVRALKTVGVLTKTDYGQGEARPVRIFEMAAARGVGQPPAAE
jgi:uncharacterized cupin superfamily protein